MKKTLIGVGIVLLLAGIGYGIWYWMNNDSGLNNGEIINGDNGNEELLVTGDFLENFRDGEIDDFWLFSNGGSVESKYDIDYVREELSLAAAGGTSQWTSDDSAPLIYFFTEDNFSIEIEMNFDPRADYEHAGVGVLDEISGEWVRLSRAYDTHALEDELDIANSVYVMEKKDGEVLKYNHANFVDTKSFLRIDRQGDEFAFYYSQKGEDWIELDKRTRADFGDKVQIYLFVYSTNPNPIKAVFRQINFSVLDS